MTNAHLIMAKRKKKVAVFSIYYIDKVVEMPMYNLCCAVNMQLAVNALWILKGPFSDFIALSIEECFGSIWITLRRSIEIFFHGFALLCIYFFFFFNSWFSSMAIGRRWGYHTLFCFSWRTFNSLENPAPHGLVRELVPYSSIFFVTNEEGVIVQLEDLY